MPHSNQGRVVSQVESIQRRFAQAPGLPFADLLDPHEVNQLLDELGIEFRDRDYPPLVTLAIWLSQCSDADPSLKQAVARYLAQRVAEGKPACSAETGAYSQARKRLPKKVIAEMTRRTGKRLMDQAPAEWSWHGRKVKVVDGSTASMPDTRRPAESWRRMASTAWSIVDAKTPPDSARNVT